MKIKTIRFPALEWRKLLGWSIGILLFTIFFLPKLGSHIPGNSIFESREYLGISSIQSIFENISYFPTKIVQFMLLKIDEPNATLLRLVSMFIAAISIAAFYILLSRWHTHRIALLGTVLFASSSVVLHLARLGNHEVLYISIVPILLLAGTWLKSKRNIHKMPYAAALASAMLYIPGAWLFLLAMGVVFKKRLSVAWKYIDKKLRIISVSIFAIISLPLLYGLTQNPGQIVRLAGYDEGSTNTLMQLFQNLLSIPHELFISGINRPNLWLVGTPILDIFTSAMFILGIYSYVKGPHPLRARLLVGMSILSAIVIMLNGSGAIMLLIPIIYLIAANGIAYMLQSWFVVFPRNPFARQIGVLLLAVAVAITSSYHIQRHYVAWPNAPETKNAFNLTE